MTSKSKKAIAVGAVLIGIAALTAWYVHSYSGADSDETSDTDE